jgi:hypothetical protein
MNTTQTSLGQSGYFLALSGSLVFTTLVIVIIHHIRKCCRISLSKIPTIPKIPKNDLLFTTTQWPQQFDAIQLGIKFNFTSNHLPDFTLLKDIDHLSSNSFAPMILAIPQSEYQLVWFTY